MLRVRLNDQIISDGEEPVVFESDCREGVCGMCGFLVNGKAHGPVDNTPACRQHLRAFPGVRRLCGGLSERGGDALCGG